MKRTIILSLAVFAMIASGAQADVTFDFNSLADGAEDAAISAYMTGVYGATVTVSDAKADDDDWVGNTTTFIRTDRYIGGDFEIVFSIPITGLITVDGYVFDGTAGVDWGMDAYGGGYGSTEDPSGGALIDSVHFSSVIDYTELLGVTLDLGDSAAHLLVFHDEGKKDVGIDNLVVSTVPVPGAALLGVMGLGLVGWLKRRFM